MFVASSSSSEINASFQQELLPDETLLWTGQPLPRVIFHKSDWYAIPFSLMWGGFSLFWEYAALGGISKNDHSVLSQSGHFHLDFMSLWGIPFLLVGQYMIWGRFFYTAWRKTHTFYAVTNKRTIVWNTAPSKKLTDGFISGLTSVSMTSSSDGTGIIEFSPEPELTGFMGNRRNNGMQMDINLSRLAFYDIENVRNVYQTIQGLRSDNSNTVYRPR